MNPILVAPGLTRDSEGRYEDIWFHGLGVVLLTALALTQVKYTMYGGPKFHVPY
jgi:hypothetical protein